MRAFIMQDFNYANKLAEREEQIVFTSTIATGHGGSRDSVFYELRRVLNRSYNEKQNPYIADAWDACENAFYDEAFISKILGDLGSRQGVCGRYREDIKKTEEAWLAALKVIAARTNSEELYKAISLKEGIERVIEKYLQIIERCWLRERNRAVEKN